MRISSFIGSIICAVLGAVSATAGILLVNGAFFAIVIYLAQYLFIGHVSTELLVGLWGLLAVACSVSCLKLCANC